MKAQYTTVVIIDFDVNLKNNGRLSVLLKLR